MQRMNRLEKAKEILKSNRDFTCVLVSPDDEVEISKQRGVKPLLLCLDSEKTYDDFVAADKVVGDGAACLYVMLNVKEIYAEIISEPALHTLEKYGISCQYSKKVKNIINRKKDGICPMEMAVKDSASIEEAVLRIKNTMEKLAKNTNK